MGKKRICRQCQMTFSYCRGCMLSPILYHENGFCSQKCQEAFKIKLEEVIPAEDVEVVITDEDTSTSI